MVAHRNSADSKSFPAVKPREGGMPTPSHRKYCAPSPTAQPRDRTHSLAWRALRDRTTGSGGMPTLCVLGCLAMARYRRYAFPGARRWQDMREMRSRATGSDKISPRCVPRRSTMARRILGNVATPHLNTADFRLSANRLSTPGTPRWASSTRASCGACR